MRLFLVVATFASFIAPQLATAQSDSAEARAEALISGGPRAWFGDTRGAIMTALGRRARYDSRPWDPKQPTAPDSVVTFHYDGATVVFFTSHGLHEDFIREVTIWAPRFLKPSPIPFGATVAQVREYFGDSSSGPTPHMVYSSTGGLVDRLELWFERDRLVRVKWIYGVD